MPPNHQLTPEERLRGNVNRRLKREAAEEKALAKLDGALERAIGVFIDAMEAEDQIGPAHETRIRAAAQVVDRVLGRATQRTEVSGSVDHYVEYRSRLSSLLTDHAERVGTNGGPE